MYCKDCGNEVSEITGTYGTQSDPPKAGDTFSDNRRVDPESHEIVCVNCGMTLEGDRDMISDD